MDEQYTQFIEWVYATYSQNTARSYARWVRIFLSNYTAESNTRSIRDIDIVAALLFKKSLQQYYAPSTVNAALVALNAWGKWAKQHDYLTSNPFSNIDYIVCNTRDQSPVSLNHDQELRILRALNYSLGSNPKTQMRLKTIVIIFLQTGIRVSELCNLIWKDIVLKERSGTMRIRSGKGGKSRIIPLSLSARQVLYEWLVMGLENKELQDLKLNTIEICNYLEIRAKEPVFPNKYGISITPRMIQREIMKLAYHAQLDHVTPHTLRHTFATKLLWNGATITEVAQLLGHSSIQTTAIYTQPSQDDLQQRIECLSYT